MHLPKQAPPVVHPRARSAEKCAGIVPQENCPPPLPSGCTCRWSNKYQKYTCQKAIGGVITDFGVACTP